MSAVCRSFFLFSGLFSGHVSRRSFCTKRFVTQIDLSLGLVAPLPSVKTDSVIQTFFSVIEKAQEGGISYIQLWGPNTELQASLPTVLSLKKLADRRNIPIIINNCVDVALQAGLAGVHLGQKDLPYHLARHHLGPSATIGLTVNTWKDVLTAQDLDVDYLGVQLFPSKHTKPPRSTDIPPWGLQGVRRITAFTRHPVVLIGNITLENLPTVIELLRPGDGIAVAGEIIRAKDPYVTAKKIDSLIKRFLCS
jgi:thiamine-phosphate pyrophosphorylase